MDTEPEDGGLPNWAEPPADLPAAVATVKAAIRARIESSGRTVEDIFAQLEALVAERTPEIHAANEESGSAWPEIDFEDIAAETVSPETRALVRRRGCVVIRGHFEHERALRWDQEILAYSSHLLVRAADGGTAERTHGARAAIPQRVLDQHATAGIGSLRPESKCDVSRPDPPPS
jgi:hypothetical protein